MTEEMHKS